MTRTITVFLADAFTTEPGKGNRAGVVLDAEGLSDGAMQAVAALVGVSETAFLSPAPEGADFDLVQRYFTPEVEVPTCGHATIGSHLVRARTLGMSRVRGRIMTGAGVLTNGRMFAPAVGLDEDPVTGNGNGPCGAYLSRYGVLSDRPVFGYLGRQGVAMGREGVIEVTVTRDASGPHKIQVGGTAVEAGRLKIELSDNKGNVPATIL